MYKSIILKSENRNELERKIEHVANNFIIEHLSFSTVAYSDYTVEYSCCLLYRSR